MTLSRRSFLAGVAALPLLSLSARADYNKSLRFLNCSNSVDEQALRLFKQTADNVVSMDTYKNEAEFIAKFLSGDPRYDVVLASDDSIAHLVQTKLLTALDRSLIHNARQINTQLLTAEFDPDRSYSLPYMWGTLGIGYRKSAVHKVPDSWKLLLDSDRYSNRTALLSEKLAVLQIAQKYLGYSIDFSKPDVIKKAEQLLIKQKPHIKTFSSNTQNLLLSGKVDLAMVWSNDFLRIMKKSNDIGYVVPKEGTLIWQKCLCIPKYAADPVTAHKFINFLLDKDIAAALAKKFRYATPNKEAIGLMDKSYLNNHAFSPPAEVLAKSESRAFPGATQNRLYNAAWGRIMGQ